MVQGFTLSTDDRRIRHFHRTARAGASVAGSDDHVTAAHECMTLARRHPEIWPVLNEATLRDQHASVNWVAALEEIRLKLSPA